MKYRLNSAGRAMFTLSYYKYVTELIWPLAAVFDQMFCSQATPILIVAAIDEYRGEEVRGYSSPYQFQNFWQCLVNKRQNPHFYLCQYLQLQMNVAIYSNAESIKTWWVCCNCLLHFNACLLVWQERIYQHIVQYYDVF